MHFGNWMNINSNNISRLASNVVNIFSNDNNKHNLNDVYNSEIYTEFKNISNMSNNELDLKIDSVDENYVNIELNNKDNDLELNDDDDYVLIDKDNLD